MIHPDERARDRLLAAAQQARRDAATAQHEAEASAARCQRLEAELATLRTASTDLVAARRQVARLEAQVVAIAELRTRATNAEERLTAALRDKHKLQERLQAVYDLKWTRLGTALRTSARKPWTLPLLPFRILKALLPKPAKAQRTSSGRSTGGKGKGAEVGTPFDPRFDDVRGRDPRPVVSILDEFTESCLAPELSLVRADRTDFDQQVRSASLVVAESAWRGNDATWSYQFNKYQEGNDLDRLLDVAREAGVPTVVWNKEDPVNYDLFLPVMRRFDHVLTTDADIVERYRTDLGHDRVSAMMFAAQPTLHNPIGRPTTPLTSVCFAGAWRGGKYPGRAERLSTLLDGGVRAGELVIYDREPAQYEQGQGFPDRFHPYIKGTLTYRQMVDEYRRHACFLNVNTVEESSTMMSRRVFEILACRTPVVSTPSAAIEAHLADVVLTPTGAAETDDVVGRLVHDADFRDRLGQRGFRTVMSAHTYQHRVAEAFAAIGRDGFDPPAEPSIDVICVSSRPDYLDHALANHRRQRYPRTRLIFVTNSDEFDRARVESAVAEFPGSRVLHMPSHLTLGECLNAALEISDAEFFAKFDDDDWYGAEYLADMVLATRFADATVYGKRSFHAHVEGADCTVVRHEGHEFEYTKLVMGGTLLVRRSDIGDIRFEAVPSGTDTRFLKACTERGLKIFSTDRFNYLMIRRATTAHHTWQISDDDFLSTSRRLGSGLLLDDVLI